jgi:hypothetical protein
MAKPAHHWNITHNCSTLICGLRGVRHNNVRRTERANIQQQSLRGQNILSRAVLFWGRRMSFVCCLKIVESCCILVTGPPSWVEKLPTPCRWMKICGAISLDSIFLTHLGHVFPGLGDRNVDVDAAAGVVQHVDIKAGVARIRSRRFFEHPSCAGVKCQP